MKLWPPDICWYSHYSDLNPLELFWAQTVSCEKQHHFWIMKIYLIFHSMHVKQYENNN